MMPGTDPKIAPPPPPIDPDGDELDASDLIIEDEAFEPEDEEASFTDHSGKALEFRSVESERPRPAAESRPDSSPAAVDGHDETVQPADESRSVLGDDGSKRPSFWVVSQVLGGWVAIVAIFIMTGIWAFTSRSPEFESAPARHTKVETAPPRNNADLEPAAPAKAEAAVQPANVEKAEAVAVKQQASPIPAKTAIEPSASSKTSGARRATATEKPPIEPERAETPKKAARPIAQPPQGEAFAGAQAYSAEMHAQRRMIDRARESLKARKYAAASQQAQRYLKRYPDGEFRRAAYLVQLRALQRDGKRDAAAKLAKELSAQSVFYGRLGEILRVQAERPLSQGDCDAARGLLVRALQLKGSGLDEAKIEKMLARCRSRGH